MKYTSIDHFLTSGKAVLAKGPVAVVLAEDAVEVDTTLRHHLAAPLDISALAISIPL